MIGHRSIAQYGYPITTFTNDAGAFAQLISVGHCTLPILIIYLNPNGRTLDHRTWASVVNCLCNITTMARNRNSCHSLAVYQCSCATIGHID